MYIDGWKRLSAYRMASKQSAKYGVKVSKDGMEQLDSEGHKGIPQCSRNLSSERSCFRIRKNAMAALTAMSTDINIALRLISIIMIFLKPMIFSQFLELSA